MSEPAAEAIAAPAPIGRRGRIDYWDVLRGVAVLGVLMANMPLMSLSAALDYVSPYTGSGALDSFAFAFVRLFADTKFITIFSLLFGAGLAFMAERAEARGQRFERIYLRRLFWLLVIGMLHGTCVWFGDILGHYAVVGFLAMWLRHWRPRSLLMAAGLLLALNLAVMLLFAAGDPLEHLELAAGQSAAEKRAEDSARFHDAFSSGSFPAMIGPRVELYQQSQVMMAVSWAGRTLALFCAGMALVRSGVLLAIRQHRRLIVRTIMVGLTVGVPLQIVNLATADWSRTAGERLVQFGTLYLVALFLSPAYMGLVALWVESDAGVGLRRRLAAVGRMALTNYLGHSVITALIFNYARQYDQWGRFAGLVLTFVIYAFQLWISPLWLDRFRFGPMEWLWRSLVYGRQPILAARTAADASPD